MTNQPCARCGERPASSGRLCPPCAEHGPLSPEEAARSRSRLADDYEPVELVAGERYDFETSDGTVWRDAVYLDHRDGQYLVRAYGFATVAIQDHEFAGAEPS